MQPFDSVSLLERSAVLDRAVDPLRKWVRAALGTGRARDALNGVWLGHPVHPTVVQVAIGAFTSASVLDLLPGNERAAKILIGTGLASAGPAALTGAADWSELHEQQQRVGLVHAAANVAGLAAYAVSLAQRLAGNEARGRALGWTGLGLLGLGGFLGGHLSFGLAAGANHAEEVPHLVPPGWQDLCAVDDLGDLDDGTPQQRLLGDVALLVVKQGSRISVLSGRCSHLAGPLHEGDLVDDGSCIRCPWHGSVFRLADGTVRGGPATASVPSFDVQVVAGRVQVRLEGAG